MSDTSYVDADVVVEFSAEDFSPIDGDLYSWIVGWLGKKKNSIKVASRTREGSPSITVVKMKSGKQSHSVAFYTPVTDRELCARCARIVNAWAESLEG